MPINRGPAFAIANSGWRAAYRRQGFDGSKAGDVVPTGVGVHGVRQAIVRNSPTRRRRCA